MFRLLGLLGGLAAVTDLGTGAAPDESLGRAVVAARLARAAGCDEETTRHVLYTSLLEHIGCTAYSLELATTLGDDIVATRKSIEADPASTRDMLGSMIPAIAHAAGRSRMSVAVAMLRHSGALDRDGPVATCEIARMASRRLGLAEPVQHSLAHTTARYGGASSAGGDDLPLPIRITHVASCAVLFALQDGIERAVAEVRRRASAQLDPGIADVFLSRPHDMLDGIGDLDAYPLLLDAEPDPARVVHDDQIAAVAGVFGDLVDLKSPWFHGHSAAVADLAAEAARRLGLPAGEAQRLRCAGHLHDIGRAAISSRIWNKVAPLSVTERDQVRLHPYHGERIVARVPELAVAARLVGTHHERLDGSGYPGAAHGSELSTAARVLAAADAYRRLVEAGPRRPASAPEDAAARLRADVTAARLDGDAVRAVLTAAGHRAAPRTPAAAGLTARQAEVLRLVATGLTNKQIAQRLVISPRTVEHHVQDVYVRIGVTSRAGAAMFAMEHGLQASPSPADATSGESG
ncbi:HD domain-containing phosphohydrolase [Microbacterium cremeum]|uniref:HD domain-containing phosphohydrolase n=1 Tax=Microbacterium cremeum TaxID=2782169 RepID=UPI0018898E66|nr:HD domain-containing phosphohydrolase [Microbacterium cremeum]